MPLVVKQSQRKAKTPHLALCHESQGFSANNRPVSLLMKSQGEYSEEVIKALKSLGYDITKMFNSEKSNLISQAIKDKFCDEDDWCYVEDFDDTTAIFCTDCCLYSVKYQMSGDSVEVADEATPVVRGVHYNPDTNGVVLTPEAEEDMDESTYNLMEKAVANPSEFLVDLFKVSKKEGDVSLPASAYAYTPDKSEVSTWKLRIDDANHTRAAVAALGAGFRGNKVEIPSEDLPAVKRKVKAAYKKFFSDQKELPEVLKSNTKETPLKEEEIQKAVAAVEELFKAQLKEKEDALEKALAKVAELEKGAVLKAREESLSFVKDEEARKTLAKSMEALSDEAFAAVVKTMAPMAKVEEESELFKQTSVNMVRVENHEEDSFDAMMKAKYAQKQ